MVNIPQPKIFNLHHSTRRIYALYIKAKLPEIMATSATKVNDTSQAKYINSFTCNSIRNVARELCGNSILYNNISSSYIIGIYD